MESSRKKMRSSRLMMVAASAFLAAAAVLMRVPGAAAEDVVCGPFDSMSEVGSCSETMKRGDTFKLDCSGTNTDLIPTALLASGASTIKVCKSSTARTSVAGGCSEEIFLNSLDGNGVKITASTAATGWTIESNGFSGDTLHINGACRTGAKGGYFDVLIEKEESSAARVTVFGALAVASAGLLGCVGMAL